MAAMFLTRCDDLHCFQHLTRLVERARYEQQNNVSSPKTNAAAGYQGPVKIELLKGAGLLNTVGTKREN